MSAKNIISRSLLSLSLILSINLSAQAASSCKGSTEKACGLNDSCTWIKTHKRKDGANVKAYCRTKPTKKSKLTSTVDTKKNIEKTQQSSKKKALDKAKTAEKKLIKKSSKTTEKTSS